MSPVKTYVVDDSPVILENLIAALEEMSAVQVIGSATDAHTAVQWLNRAQEPFDLMIIDVFLNGGSGLGVLRAAAQFPHPHSSVVLTNYATPEMRAKCRELGVDRVFDKSEELDDLIAYCGRLANGSSTVPGALG